MKATTANDIRSTLLSVVGHVKNIDMMLMDVSFPVEYLSHVSYVTGNIHRDLHRMSNKIAEAIEREKNTPKIVRRK